LDILHRII